MRPTGPVGSVGVGVGVGVAVGVAVGVGVSVGIGVAVGAAVGLVGPTGVVDEPDAEVGAGVVVATGP
ncbi:hypothetical protein BK121_28055 [Paenibacillus odorifer]|nr:hypothetical protein BK121_28055 [Paenibacillus odorifer]